MSGSATRTRLVAAFQQPDHVIEQRARSANERLLRKPACCRLSRRFPPPRSVVSMLMPKVATGGGQKRTLSPVPGRPSTDGPALRPTDGAGPTGTSYSAGTAPTSTGTSQSGRPHQQARRLGPRRARTVRGQPHRRRWRLGRAAGPGRDARAVQRAAARDARGDCVQLSAVLRRHPAASSTSSATRPLASTGRARIGGGVGRSRRATWVIGPCSSSAAAISTAANRPRCQRPLRLLACAA